MKSYSTQEIYNAFKSIKSDSTLLVHSSLASLGKHENVSLNVIPTLWIETLSEIAKNGTLLMPAFNYTFPKTRFLDLNTARSEVGILSEAFRQTTKIRSNHPMFSFCGSGKRAKEILMPKSTLENMGEWNPFLENSVYHRLYLENAVMAFVGIDIRVCTYMVYIEAMCGVKYRYFKPFLGEILTTENKRIKGEFYHFCLPLSETLKVNYFHVQQQMLENGILKAFPLGASSIYLFYAQEFFNFIKQSLANSPFILLETPPKRFYTFKNEEEIILEKT